MPPFREMGGIFKRRETTQVNTRNEYIEVKNSCNQKNNLNTTFGEERNNFRSWLPLSSPVWGASLDGNYLETYHSLFKKKTVTIRAVALLCSERHSEEKLNGKMPYRSLPALQTAFAQTGEKRRHWLHLSTSLWTFGTSPWNPSILILTSQPRASREPFTCELSIRNTTYNHWVSRCTVPNHNNCFWVPRSHWADNWPPAVCLHGWCVSQRGGWMDG